MFIYRVDVIKLGFLNIGDVVRANNSSHFNGWGTSLLSSEQNFHLMSLIDSYPVEWRAFAKSFTEATFIEEIPNDPKIGLGQTATQFQSSTSPLNKSMEFFFVVFFFGKKQIPPLFKRKMLTDKCSDLNVEWDKVCSLLFRLTLESKTKEFQYKILHCIAFVCKLNAIYSA